MKPEIGKVYRYSSWYSRGATSLYKYEDTICKVCHKIFNICGNKNEIKFQICPICEWTFRHWIWNQEDIGNPNITKTQWTKINVNLFLLSCKQEEECISNE